ncbi:hypothetical protein [Proteiniborus sp.]|uniref:hypothetical protein n=1 Tax=Proteiniborus sp. TaxID=2079015 RepID=UPI003333EC3F
MKTLVCIDDTDNLESRGTGKLAQLMIEHIEKEKLGNCSYISRHQLYVHPDIPYTSHNSSMCFMVENTKDLADYLISYGSDFLVKESAEGSDPGLCVVSLEKLKDYDAIIAYGQRAKKEVLTKKLAYETAKRLGIHLSEHGGTGQGVVGALAGVGLRLSGNDGRIKGKIHFETENGFLTAKEIKKRSNIEVIQSLDYEDIDDNELIKLGEKVKAVLLYNKQVLLVYKKYDEEIQKYVWHSCEKEHYKKY